MNSTPTHPQEPAFIQQTFSRIARRYDLANHVLSAGLDFGWREKVGRLVAAEKPSLILDLATGSGDLALTLARHCPKARIIGADFCLPMLQEAAKKHVPRLVCADGMRLPFANDTFDVLTVAFGLRNMSSYPDAVREFRRVVRPGGLVLVLDFSMPGPVLRPFYRFYLQKILPRIAGWLTGDRSAYDYLSESIEAFPRGRKMICLFEESDLNAPNRQPMAAGIVTLYTARK
ncbi:MAG TPA: ubiquinone/menaquinone biosynthesis methyltransferase [Chthoniobacterales bacterium]